MIEISSTRSSWDVAHFVRYARERLESAGIDARIEPVLSDEEESRREVAVVTPSPYAAWRALTGQQDAGLENDRPAAITERLFGFEVTIGTERAFAKVSQD